MRCSLFFILIALAGCSHKTPVADLYNAEASTPAGLAFNPLEWKVINSSINTRYHTMSTLYGNDSAVQCARSKSLPVYPAAAVLVLVTWQQKEDPHWYGARLPGAVISVERVSFNHSGSNALKPFYEKYEGTPLQKTMVNNPDSMVRRINVITSERASVMP